MTRHEVSKVDRSYGCLLVCTCGWRRLIRVLPHYMSGDDFAAVAYEAKAVIAAHIEYKP